jgi:hypothetical protein
MSPPNDETIRARLATMSTTELHAATTTNRDDYVPRALELVEEELARRAAGPVLSEEAAVVRSVRGSGRRTRGWDIWLAIIATVAVGRVFVALILGAPASSVVIQIALALMVLVGIAWMRARFKR